MPNFAAQNSIIMNKLYSLLTLALGLGLAACSSIEEDNYVGTTPLQDNHIGQLSYVAPTFAQPDNSKTLGGKSRRENLNTLIKLIDPQRALDRSLVELTDEQFKTIKATADDICKSATTASQKISKLNTWVHNNVTYDYADNSPWSVFQSKRGICQGYANLLKAMLLTQDIPCITVNGWYSTSTQYAAHAWNYAYTGTSWRICDPTSGGNWTMTSSDAAPYEPDMADIDLFEDDDFCYNYYETHLNISRVKHGTTDLVLPYSTNGYRITMFNPSHSIPTSIQNIYIGSNIRSLGQNIIGLVAYPSFDEMCYVDPANTEIGSANGVVYWKDWQGKLTSILYIPSMMKTIVLQPMEKVEKNTIYHQQGVEEIVFSQGTKYLEAYAIEDCPNLRAIYIPEDCDMDPQAIYNCPNDVDIIIGVPTGIKQVRL